MLDIANIESVAKYDFPEAADAITRFFFNQPKHAREVWRTFYMHDMFWEPSLMRFIVAPKKLTKRPKLA